TNAELNAIKAATTTGTHTLTFTNGSLSAPVTVTIYDSGDEGTGKSSIYANGFALTEAEAAGLTAAIAKTRSSLISTNVAGANNTNLAEVAVGSLTAINGGYAGESFLLKFTNNAPSPAITATVTVKIYDAGEPGADKSELYANDFAIVKTTVNGLTDAGAKAMAQVRAKDIGGSDAVSSVLVDQAQLNVIKGSTTTGRRPLTFTYAGLTADITVRIADVVSGGLGMASLSSEIVALDVGLSELAANHFTLTQAEAAALTPDRAKELADVWAKNISGIRNPAEVTVGDLTAIKAAAPGDTFQLTFTNPSGGLTADVTVTIMDEGGTSTTDLSALYANSFEINLSAAAALDNDSVKVKSGVRAKDAFGVGDAPVVAAVDVAAAELNIIKTTLDPGVYPLTFTYAGIIAKVNVTLLDQSELAANHFALTPAEAAALTANRAKEKADVWAKTTKGVQNSAAVTVGSLTAIKAAAPGDILPLTFTNPSGGKTATVNVRIYNAGGSSTTDLTELYANDFAIKLSDAPGLTDASVKTKAEVRAKDAFGIDDVPSVVVDQTQLDAIKATMVNGNYPLTFTYGGITATINVKITDAPTYTIRFLPGVNGKESGRRTYANIPYGATWSAASIVPPTPVPANSHYVFTKWTPQIPAGSYVITANATYTSNFVLDDHTLAYNGNGHTDGVAPTATKQTHGTSVTIKDKETLIKANHTFTGWNTAADGSGNYYASGDTVSVTNNMTLFAQWTYNGGGTTPPPTNPPANPPANPPVNPPADPPATPPDTPTPPPVAVSDPTIPQSPGQETGTTTNGDADIVSRTGSSTTITGYKVEDMVRFEEQTGNIFNDLADNLVPGGSFIGQGAWSLINLLLSLIAVIIAAVTIVGAISRRRFANGVPTYDGNVRNAQTNLLRSLVIITGILTAVIWLCVDNLTTPVAWINKYTLVVGIVFIVHLIFFFIYRTRRVKDNIDNYEEDNNKSMTA
ncbi:MAG: InlB B-repeat-containing protein, partial [Clostridiales Family XIII bacterium]|nr:InlB B-repeat-containing protein [Clostridiales Family XIII bacterium]